HVERGRSGTGPGPSRPAGWLLAAAPAGRGARSDLQTRAIALDGRRDPRLGRLVPRGDGPVAEEQLRPDRGRAGGRDLARCGPGAAAGAARLTRRLVARAPADRETWRAERKGAAAPVGRHYSALGGRVSWPHRTLADESLRRHRGNGRRNVGAGRFLPSPGLPWS